MSLFGAVHGAVAGRFMACITLKPGTPILSRYRRLPRSLHALPHLAPERWVRDKVCLFAFFVYLPSPTCVCVTLHYREEGV